MVLDRILRERLFKLRGILNGIDVAGYDPETDSKITANYSAKDISGKAVNKAELQKMFALEINPDKPIVSMVSRLVAHKGFDLVRNILDELIATTDIQFVILGSGDKEYEEFFLWIAEKYPGRVGVRIGFVPALARAIYAGSDIFLMPSKSEPCGLSQMVALRYGTIPVVRETGGLADTITDSGDGSGNGFTFKSYNAHDMLGSVRRALEGYKNADGWKILVKRAMECDNSWDRSANEYIKLYKEIL